MDMPEALTLIQDTRTFLQNTHKLLTMNAGPLARLVADAHDYAQNNHGAAQEKKMAGEIEAIAADIQVVIARLGMPRSILNHAMQAADDADAKRSAVAARLKV